MDGPPIRNAVALDGRKGRRSSASRRRAVEGRAEAKVLELINGLHAVDIAEILDEQSTKEARAFYAVLPEIFLTITLNPVSESGISSIITSIRSATSG